MQAVILAAGESSRFWPQNQRHKSQIKILGRSLVYWTAKGIIDKGIKDIILITSPNSSLKEELSGLEANIDWVVQEKPLSTGNALLQAKDKIKEPFLVFWPYKVNSGEIVEKILKLVDQEKAELVLTGAEADNPWEYGIIKMENDKVTEIVEKPERGKEPSNVKTLGSYFLQPDFFDYYQKIENNHLGDFIDALNLYIKEKAVGLVILEKEVPTLKYPWEALRAMEFMFGSNSFEPSVSSSVKLGKNVVINGDVFIGDNVIIGDNTTITGPCFIGDNCKIGASNVLRGSVNLERDVITGAFMEIKNSLVQEGTHFHSGYLGDSVVGRNCRFGVGFTTANRRVDRGNIKSQVREEKIDTALTYLGVVVGDNTCFGMRSGTMPGILIGSGSLIGPGTLVFENIEDNTTFYTEFKNVKKDKPTT